jgi:hypothetical protein
MASKEAIDDGVCAGVATTGVRTEKGSYRQKDTRGAKGV